MAHLETSGSGGAATAVHPRLIGVEPSGGKGRALGSAEVTLLQQAAAYRALADGYVRAEGTIVVVLRSMACGTNRVHHFLNHGRAITLC